MDGKAVNYLKISNFKMKNINIHTKKVLIYKHNLLIINALHC
jgi:hypothetical protein